MLRLTRRSEYGIIAIAHLASRQGEAVSAREIAERYRVPKRLLAEVMKDLVHAGVIRSTRGAFGGYRLAVDPARTSIRTLLGVLEGPFEMVQCAGDPSHDSVCELLSSCPVRGPLQRIHERIHHVLDEVTLSDLVVEPSAMSAALAAPKAASASH